MRAFALTARAALRHRGRAAPRARSASHSTRCRRPMSRRASRSSPICRDARLPTRVDAAPRRALGAPRRNSRASSPPPTMPPLELDRPAPARAARRRRRRRVAAARRDHHRLHHRRPRRVRRRAQLARRATPAPAPADVTIRIIGLPHYATVARLPRRRAASTHLHDARRPRSTPRPPAGRRLRRQGPRLRPPTPTNPGRPPHPLPPLTRR